MRDMNWGRLQMKVRRIPACCFFAFFCAIWVYSVSARAESALVRWVDDGDTIVLADGRRIRYIGIDAPEIGHDDIRSQPLGPEAKNFNRQLVFHQYIRLEFDKEKTDHYGRFLAYIFGQSDIFINKEILHQGYAYYLFRHPNIRYHSILLEAQRSAMKAGRGIWREWNEKDGRYIGNKSSKRFHLDNCPLARKISFANRIYFRTRWDALWEGYAPGKKCLPGGLSQ